MKNQCKMKNEDWKMVNAIAGISRTSVMFCWKTSYLIGSHILICSLIQQDSARVAL